jgi:hypothetical protein
MAIRAKFKVSSVEHNEGGTSTLNSYPVTSGSEENKEFFKYTPGGNIKLSVLKTEALEGFDPGTEFYVVLTPAPKPEN